MFTILLKSFLKKYGIRNWRQNVDECIDILVDEQVRNEFIALVRWFNRCMDEVLPDPAALKYLTDLKILAFIKESARNRYRDDKLSIKDASNKIREIVEEYLIFQGIDPKIPPTPLFEDKFLEKLHKKSSKAKAQELQHAIIEYIDEHWEEDPELYERFSDRLKRLLQEYKENGDAQCIELEKLREELKKGREAEQTYGLDPKKEMPFFGLLKDQIFGKKPVSELSEREIDFLVSTTRDLVELISREVQAVDFWESATKQRKLKSYIISHLLEKISPAMYENNHDGVKTETAVYISNSSGQNIFNKRNEIAQRLLELAYHHFRK